LLQNKKYHVIIRPNLYVYVIETSCKLQDNWGPNNNNEEFFDIENNISIVIAEENLFATISDQNYSPEDEENVK
jgi:hypothetical protein